jgi:hypothetical protein
MNRHHPLQKDDGHCKQQSKPQQAQSKLRVELIDELLARGLQS